MINLTVNIILIEKKFSFIIKLDGTVILSRLNCAVHSKPYRYGQHSITAAHIYYFVTHSNVLQYHIMK